MPSKRSSDRNRAHHADRAALRRARRPKPSKLAENPELRAIVEEKLEDWWSPQQVARWLRRSYPDNQEMYVSHETIYLSLFVQGKGALTPHRWILRTVDDSQQLIISRSRVEPA